MKPVCSIKKRFVKKADLESRLGKRRWKKIETKGHDEARELLKADPEALRFGLAYQDVSMNDNLAWMIFNFSRHFLGNRD